MLIYSSKMFWIKGLYYPEPQNKISLQSVDNVLRNDSYRPKKHTNRQTNTTKTITFFAKEVIIVNKIDAS